MSNCRLCKKPLDAGQNNGSRHNICDNESMRRVSMGLCAWCGKNPMGKYSFAQCEPCISSNADYENYPGP